MTADFPDWAAPQAHATAISTTGAPLLVLATLVDQLVGQTLTHNSSITRPASGRFTINQPGYEIWVNVATLGSVAPVISVELQWFDSHTGARLDDELYYFYCGNLNAHLIHGRGPTKADRLVVVITNYHATQDCTFSYTVLQTSRIYTREFWHTIGQGQVQPVYPGLTAAASNISANVLSDDSHLETASQSLDFILPLYTGTVRIMGVTTDPAAGNSKWIITSVTDQVAPTAIAFEGAQGQTGFAPFGAVSLYASAVPLPRSQCKLTLLNGNASASETLSVAIVAQEDRA